MASGVKLAGRPNGIAPTSTQPHKDRVAVAPLSSSDKFFFWNIETLILFIYQYRWRFYSTQLLLSQFVMDGVSGAFAVVSLAIQLFETVQETSRFVKEIKNAPSEVVKLAESLQQLGSTLRYVRQLLEQQVLVLRLPGSPAFILDALRNCEAKIKPLDEITRQMKEAPDGDNRAKRLWTSFRLVIKKEQIQELAIQLREAKSDLQFSISANLWQLQQV